MLRLGCGLSFLGMKHQRTDGLKTISVESSELTKSKLLVLKHCQQIFDIIRGHDCQLTIYLGKY